MARKPAQHLICDPEDRLLGRIGAGVQTAIGQHIVQGGRTSEARSRSITSTRAPVRAAPTVAATPADLPPVTMTS
ncbi:hypothetical protein [Nocardia salmonicida]|uniref:hypothetical protein n=1 Tax=Nocardia salmonicida TaxID=53431 RepID=UPI002E295343|nr:hypothetical protein [Nocardia salmonicida]